MNWVLLLWFIDEDSKFDYDGRNLSLVILFIIKGCTLIYVCMFYVVKISKRQLYGLDE